MTLRPFAARLARRCVAEQFGLGFGAGKISTKSPFQCTPKVSAASWHSCEA